MAMKRRHTYTSTILQPHYCAVSIKCKFADVSIYFGYIMKYFNFFLFSSKKSLQRSKSLQKIADEIERFFGDL